MAVLYEEDDMKLELELGGFLCICAEIPDDAHAILKAAEILNQIVERLMKIAEDVEDKQSDRALIRRSIDEMLQELGLEDA